MHIKKILLQNVLVYKSYILFKVSRSIMVIMNPNTSNLDYVRPFLLKISKFYAKRWNLQVLWELHSYKKLRYGELQESLKGISPSTLAEVLKSLHKDGLVERTVYGKIPPYRKSGTELIVASSALVKWAMKNKKK